MRIACVALLCSIVISGCGERKMPPPDYIGVLRSSTVNQEASEKAKLYSNYRIMDIVFEDGTVITGTFRQPFPILAPGRSYGVWRVEDGAGYDNYEFQEMGLEKGEERSSPR